MSSRMDKYNNESEIPTRSNKNKALYKQIYNAYDEFENLIVPSNAREINLGDLKKEITSREEYQAKIEYDILGNDNQKKEEKLELEHVTKKEDNDDIYDINELIDKAVSKKEDNKEEKKTISNGDYLKRLKLDNRKTNIEQVKEMYDEIKEETLEEDEALLKTANLSLEILSDLKSDNDNTMVSAPIKNEEMPTETEMDFYSSRYKFSKKDFDDDDDEEDEEDDDDDIKEKKVKKEKKKKYEEDDEDEDDDEEDDGNGKFFIKILALVFGILIIIGGLIFFWNYFNKV